MGVHDHSAPQTPDLVEQQKQQDLNFLGIQTNWAEQALSRQVFTLKSAIAKLREESVPKGSRLRAFLIRECKRVCDAMSELPSAHGSSSGRKPIGSDHRDSSPDAPQDANRFACSRETLERRKTQSIRTSGFRSDGRLERQCHICKERTGWEGLTRNGWFACGYCLEGNEKWGPPILWGRHWQGAWYG